MMMMKKQNFEVGHPIVFLINDYVNTSISRHNYVYMYFIAATCFDLTSHHRVYIRLCIRHKRYIILVNFLNAVRKILKAQYPLYSAGITEG